jgi:catalase
MATKKPGTNQGPLAQPHGQGGELHQVSIDGVALTTNQGTPIGDNQNSLRVGARGPTLFEDFILREKITHFDHERIPERIVHARGYGAKGYFQPYESQKALTRATFLQDPEQKTPVFVRFSTVAGARGSFDTARDVRGFAVKFYTPDGNFDLVGNNIPVFFIQDAMKFPDLVHAVKEEPDRGFPQAQSAHDTFWDFVSLMPESMHMLMWVMSDRAIPRSFRMMEGFGVHTFQLVNEAHEAVFVKFHWRPKLGSFSLVWDEAVKISGADPDFHRRDIWESIGAGDFPEYELGLQVFDQKTADSFDFDVLDPTKLVPEELVPIRMIGKMVLDENVDDFHAETEQVAFCPSHVVPGIDFSNDPLLQGRIHSYIDTQLKRLGGPNFHEIPVNRPRCPIHNFTRGGHMRMDVRKGRVAYEPNSLDPGGPRANLEAGFTTIPAREEGDKQRVRSESFADHYTQARLFWRSMSEPEQAHIVGAFSFELGKVETADIRRRMLGHLDIIHPDLGARVAAGLGMSGQAITVQAAVAPKDMKPSPALSLVAKAPESFAGRKIGLLVTDGSDAKLVAALRKAAKAEGARVEVVAPLIGGVKLSDGAHLRADHFLAGAPSVLFDAVVLAPSDAGAADLTGEAAAVDWLRMAFAHLKVIGHVAAAAPLFELASVDPAADDGLVAVDTSGVEPFIAAARRHRIWAREPKVKKSF